MCQVCDKVKNMDADEALPIIGEAMKGTNGDARAHLNSLVDGFIGMPSDIQRDPDTESLEEEA